MKSRASRAENERIFRAVNEQIEKLNETFESLSGEQPQFLCECDDALCVERLTLPLDQVEQVHAQPRRFVVKPGHEDPAVERIVERNDAYSIVEKYPDSGVSA